MNPQAILTPGGIADQLTRGLSGVAQSFQQAQDRRLREQQLAAENERANAYLGLAQQDRQRGFERDAYGRQRDSIADQMASRDFERRTRLDEEQLKSTQLQRAVTEAGLQERQRKLAYETGPSLSNPATWGPGTIGVADRMGDFALKQAQIAKEQAMAEKYRSDATDAGAKYTPYRHRTGQMKEVMVTDPTTGLQDVRLVPESIDLFRDPQGNLFRVGQNGFEPFSAGPAAAMGAQLPQNPQAPLPAPGSAMPPQQNFLQQKAMEFQQRYGK